MGRRVYSPGLPEHPGRDVARRQMTGFVRLSPGCEHRKDLVADLIEGLAAIAHSRESRAATV